MGKNLTCPHRSATVLYWRWDKQYCSSVIELILLSVTAGKKALILQPKHINQHTAQPESSSLCVCVWACLWWLQKSVGNNWIKAGGSRLVWLRLDQVITRLAMFGLCIFHVCTCLCLSMCVSVLVDIKHWAKLIKDREFALLFLSHVAPSLFLLLASTCPSTKKNPI